MFKKDYCLNLGQSPDLISQMKLGTNPFSDVLKKAKKPMIILGAEQLNRKDGARILAEAQSLSKLIEDQGNLSKDWKVMNILHTNASQVSALDLGYASSLEDLKRNQTSIIFLLGVDNEYIKKEDFKESFIIYIGSHGDHGALISDIILPGAAYTEKCGSYVNTEGRAQQTNAAITPPGVARSDWKIVRALSEIAGHCLPYDNLIQIRNRIEEVAPHLVRYGKIESSNFTPQLYELSELIQDSLSCDLIDIKQKTLDQFFMTDTISRASPTMAKCVQAVLKQHA